MRQSTATAEATVPEQKHRIGVAFKVIAIGVTPLVIVSFLTVFFMNESEKVFSEISKQADSVFDQVISKQESDYASATSIYEAADQIYRDLFSVFETKSELDGVHQKGLLLESTQGVQKSIDLTNTLGSELQNLSISLEEFNSVIEASKILERAEGLPGGDVAVYDLVEKRLRFLIASSIALQRLFDAYKVSNTSTISLMSEGSFGEAVNNFVFEEVSRSAAFQLRMEKFSEQLEMTVADLLVIKDQKKTASTASITQTRELNQQQASEELDDLSRFNLIAMVALCLMAVGCVVIYSRTRLAKPIRAITHTMTDLSKGNLEVSIPDASKDEIGDMARAVAVFKDNAIRSRDLEIEKREAEQRAQEEKVQAMVGMADQFDSSVGGLIMSLSSASTELNSTAGSMRTVAEKTLKSSGDVHKSSGEASSNVETVASAMEEMAASAREVVYEIDSVKVKSDSAATSARTANKTVGNLDQLAQNIGEVVMGIQAIAEQTNLLALNATIEAARAGDSGKGFAVVADEVKKLATETSNRTEEIGSRIAEIQTATNESVAAMEAIIESVSDIDNSISSVSASIEQQNSTTSEIVQRISEASNGVSDVTKVINDVQQGAQETGSAADAVLEASQEMSELSENLKASVDSFLSTIRSGSAIQKGTA